MFTSDNGASREGEATGTTSYYVHLADPSSDVDADLARLDEIGGPTHDAALPAGLGDGVEHAVPALQDQHPRRRPLGAVRRVRGRPALAAGVAGSIRHQYAHVTDLLPTLLELAGVDPPTSANGRCRSSRMAGRSASRRRSLDAAAPSTHPEQHYEMHGPPRLLPRRLGGGHPPPAR